MNNNQKRKLHKKRYIFLNLKKHMMMTKKYF